MKIIFLGSADFGIPSLTALLEKHEVCAVVSTPARPQGRGLQRKDSPIVEFSRKNGISAIHTPADLKSGDITDLLRGYGADLFVVVAFRILPRTLFSIPPYGTINVHASLLPRYRGPAPIQRAIEAGEKETGVTIFRIDDGVDTGEMLVQKPVPIGSDDTTPMLYSRLSRLGSQALLEGLEEVVGGTLVPVAQDHTSACGAPKLAKNEAHIDWKNPPERIFNKIRAFKPFPGTYAVAGGKRLGIIWAQPVDRVEQAEPGTIVRVEQDSFDVQCSGGVLKVVAVKPEGRTEMNVRDFLLGHSLRQGMLLS